MAARAASALLAVLACGACAPFARGRYRTLPGGRFSSELTVDGGQAEFVPSFEMRRHLVTVSEYRRFVLAHPLWRRDRIPPLYASSGYLASWLSPTDPGPALDASSPVTEVSWFAARAYCAWERAGLPSWRQWEYAAASDRFRRDARGDPSRNARLLRLVSGRDGWRPGPVARGEADVYGLYDMNGLVWEWTDDYAALFVNADARDPARTNLLRLCGGAALAFKDRSRFPLIMRVGALSGMRPKDSSVGVGFRCARPARAVEATDGGASLYQIKLELRDQRGRAFSLGAFRGSPLIVSMMYASCRAACPMTVETIKAIRREAKKLSGAAPRVLLVSFDPSRDTSARLKEMADAHGVSSPDWTFARVERGDLRAFAALLGISYRTRPGGEMSHNVRIVLLGPNGSILDESDELGRPSSEFVAAVARAAAAPER